LPFRIPIHCFNRINNLSLGNIWVFSTPLTQVSHKLYNDLYTHHLYAAAAYCLKGIKNLDWICDRCIQDTRGTILFDYFEQGISDTVGYIAFHPIKKIIIVAFRGSESTQNWLWDGLFATSGIQISRVYSNLHKSFIKPSINAKVHTISH
jgi:hypothetical protein